MRCALALLSVKSLSAASLSVVLLAACGSPRASVTTHATVPPSSRGHAEAARVPVLRSAGSQRFRAVRAEVTRLSLENTAVRIATTGGAGSTRDDVLELPLSEKTADVVTLLVVAVYPGRVRVGATETRLDGALVVAASAFAAKPGTVALMRIDDEASLDDVLRVSAALHDAYIDVRVLGSVSPAEPAPNVWGSGCPFPLERAGASGGVVVKVLVDDDGGGRAGVVHVLGTPEVGFAWPAAVCATLNRFEASSAAPGQPRLGRPLAIKFVP